WASRADGFDGWFGPVRATTAAVCLAAVCGLGWMAWRQSSVWHDSVSAWTAMIERNPRFHMGYYNLAAAYKRNGDVDTAVQAYEQAIVLYPHYPEANVNLGNILRQRGDLRGAVQRYRTSLRGRPDFHMAHMNLGSTLIQLGQANEAIPHLERAAAGARKAGDTQRAESIERQLRKMRGRAASP
ncbi:MAG: tetratricopeptide repeat protein, partial [Phycisphaerae bacterium]